MNKSTDLACEFHGVISEPGAKTLAWPRGRWGGSAREGGGGPCFSTRGSWEVRTVLWAQSSMPENRKMTQKIKFEKNLVEKNFKNRKSWKKRTRGTVIP